MQSVSNNIAQQAVNTRTNLSKQYNPLQKEKAIVIFNKKATSEQKKKQAYLDYSGLMLDKFDTNKDGKVTKEEYIKGNFELNYETKKKLYKEPNDERDIVRRTLMHRYETDANFLDINADGHISKEEYAMFILMCDRQGGVPEDGKFTLSDEEEAYYQIRMNKNEEYFINMYKNNPFLEK